MTLGLMGFAVLRVEKLFHSGAITLIPKPFRVPGTFVLFLSRHLGV